MSMIRYGSSTLREHLPLPAEHPLVLLGRVLDPVTNENISTLWNWCTRMIPRVSLPYDPASRR